MSEIKSSNKYFEFYELIHQVKLKNKDRSSPFIASELLGKWNSNCIKDRYYDMQKTYGIYEKTIEQLRPALSIAKKDKLYLKLISSSKIKKLINEYINSLIVIKYLPTDNVDEFFEYLNFLFIADIYFIMGLYSNELEAEKNNINSPDEARSDALFRSNELIKKINQMIPMLDNTNNDLFYNNPTHLSDLKSQLSIQLTLEERKLMDLNTMNNTKGNYLTRILISRLSNYIFSNYGLHKFPHKSLVELLISHIGAGGTESISTDVINRTIRNVRKKNTYMRTPKNLRKKAWRSGFKLIIKGDNTSA